MNYTTMASTYSFLSKQSANNRTGGAPVPAAADAKSRRKTDGKKDAATTARGSKTASKSPTPTSSSSSSVVSSLVNTMERLSSIVDDSLCSNVRPAAAANDASHETDDTALNSSNEHELHHDGNGNSNSLAFSSPESDFESWLESHEVDASAITAIAWNGDVTDNDVGKHITGKQPWSPVGGSLAEEKKPREGRSKSRHEFLGWDEGGHDGGYASLANKKRDNGRNRWPGEIMSDAWDRVASTGLSCFEAAAPLNQAGAMAVREELIEKQRRRSRRGTTTTGKGNRRR